MISATLCNIGVVAGVWAIIWLLLDHTSTATGPILLMVAGLLCLLAGGILV